MLLALRRRRRRADRRAGHVRAEGYGPLPCPAVLVSRSFDLPWEAGAVRGARAARARLHARGARAAAGGGRRRGGADRRARRTCSPTCAARGVERLLCEGGPTLNRALLARRACSTSCSSRSRRSWRGEDAPAIIAPGRARAAVAALRRDRRRRAVPALQRVGSAAMRIEGANALVAGGASGLGAATARRLRAARRARHDRRPQRREGRGAGARARRARSSAATSPSPSRSRPRSPPPRRRPADLRLLRGRRLGREGRRQARAAPVRAVPDHGHAST